MGFDTPHQTHCAGPTDSSDFSRLRAGDVSRIGRPTSHPTGRRFERAVDVNVGEAEEGGDAETLKTFTI